MIYTDCKNVAVSCLGSDLQKMIEGQSLIYEIDPYLTKALVEIESAGDTFAVRAEPKWNFRYEVQYYANKNKTTHDTESVLQSCSWGLMQIMGTVAREMGFSHSLPMLCVPEIGLEFGLKKLKTLLNKYKAINHAVSAYNAGSLIYSKQGNLLNQVYVTKVIAKYGELRLAGEGHTKQSQIVT